MFAEVFLFKLRKCRQCNNKIIMILVCILITISYLHGENYAHCQSIYPDEIMDLQCSIFLSHSRYEESICYKSRVDLDDITSVDIQILPIYGVCMANPSFFIECSQLQDFEKRLFLLKRYNS